MAVFAGKSVLVTGGSRGIGRAVAVRFAELGAAKVAISYLRNDSAAEETEEKHWDWTLNANSRALFTLVRHAAPQMEPGSAVVATTSLGSQRVLDNYVLVGVSKAALEALVRYFAVELAERDIRVNAVSAGLVETGALAYFPNREAMLEWYERRTPAGRLVEPRDVAEVVCFLASPAAEMIRGQTVIVDGGYSVLA
jgi:enoyl-[acyl-carrier protein] reductase III